MSLWGDERELVVSPMSCGRELTFNPVRCGGDLQLISILWGRTSQPYV